MEMEDIIELAAEMQIKYDDFLDMTWREFYYNYTGLQRRIERGWDYTRHLMSATYNSAGAKPQLKAKDIMKLTYLDAANSTIPKKMSEDRIKKLLKYVK